MHQYAHIHCVSKNLYNQDPSRTPVSYGVLDSHMVWWVFYWFLKLPVNNYFLFLFFCDNLILSVLRATYLNFVDVIGNK